MPPTSNVTLTKRLANVPNVVDCDLGDRPASSDINIDCLQQTTANSLAVQVPCGCSTSSSTSAANSRRVPSRLRMISLAFARSPGRFATPRTPPTMLPHLRLLKRVLMSAVGLPASIQFCTRPMSSPRISDRCCSANPSGSSIEKTRSRGSSPCEKLIGSMASCR